MSHQRVCAVVVAHSSAGHLAGLVPDLLETVDDVVVVDHASPDGSAALAAQLGARVLRVSANPGYAAGVNRGVASSDADAFLVVNPDVRLAMDCVEALTLAAARHPGDVLGPVAHDPRGNIQPTRSGLPGLLTLLGEELLIPESSRVGSWPARLWTRWQRYDAEEPGPLLSGVCLWIPREAWRLVGPMDEGYFMYREEMDWQLRAQVEGVRTVLVPSARLVHARSASSGLHDPRRARWLAASNRRFLRRWLPGWRGGVALALLAVGQALRLAAWSAPGLRRRAAAAGRRAQHRAALATLVRLL